MIFPPLKLYISNPNIKEKGLNRCKIIIISSKEGREGWGEGERKEW